MNRNRLRTIGRAASVLLLSAAFSGCTLGPKASSQELPERVESALHRSDHEGLIAYYNAEAAAAREKASWHRRLAASYAGLPSAEGGSDMAMAAHCNSIAELYEQVARDYDEMAQFHQLLARVPELTKP